jgi:hypothetical protein
VIVGGEGHRAQSLRCGASARPGNHCPGGEGKAEQIRKASDLWELEGWPADQRRRIDRTFDYRYSVLPFVFAALLREGSCFLVAIDPTVARWAGNSIFTVQVRDRHLVFLITRQLLQTLIHAKRYLEE